MLYDRPRLDPHKQSQLPGWRGYQRLSIINAVCGALFLDKNGSRSASEEGNRKCGDLLRAESWAREVCFEGSLQTKIGFFHYFNQENNNRERF